MRRWGAIVVFALALLLAYQPAAASDTQAQDQEVSALVAHGSEAGLAAPLNASIHTDLLTTEAPDAEQATEALSFAATSAEQGEGSSTRRLEHARTDFSGRSRPRTITSGGYDVLKMPQSRGA